MIASENPIIPGGDGMVVVMKQKNNFFQLKEPCASCVERNLLIRRLFVTLPLCYVSLDGCHIDGFIALIAHTHVLLAEPVVRRQDDVNIAARTAAEVALLQGDVYKGSVIAERILETGEKIAYF